MQYKDFYVELPVRANNVTMLDGVVQNDTANIVHAQLMTGDKPFNFDGFTNIVLTVLTPAINPLTGKNIRVVAMTSSDEDFSDENPYSIQAIEPEEGRIDFALTGALTLTVGEYFAQIEVLDAGEVITSAKVNYRVKDNLLDNAPAGTFLTADQQTGLQDILNQLSGWVSSFSNWNVAEGARTSNESVRIGAETQRTTVFQEMTAEVNNMLSTIAEKLDLAAASADRAYFYSQQAATPTQEAVEQAISELDWPSTTDVASMIETNADSDKDWGDFEDDYITVQIRRGLKEDLPGLDIGELGYTTDEKHLYIGTSAGNRDLSQHFVHSSTQPTDTNILWIDAGNNNAIKFFDETEQEWTPTATSVFG